MAESEKKHKRWRIPAFVKRKKETVGVIGAGAWGTAVAKNLAENGHDVTLWALKRRPSTPSIQRTSTSYTCPQLRLPDNLRATGDPLEAATARTPSCSPSPRHTFCPRLSAS